MTDQWTINLHATKRMGGEQLKVKRSRLNEDTDVVDISVGGARLSIFLDRDAHLDKFPF